MIYHDMETDTTETVALIKRYSSVTATDSIGKSPSCVAFQATRFPGFGVLRIVQMNYSCLVV